MKTMIRKISLLVIAICMVSACGESKFIFTGSVEKVIDGLDFPEGPVYAGNDLLFSNCYGMWIGRLTEDGRLDTFSNLSGNELKPNGLYWSADEYLWACEYHKGRILKLNNKGELVKIFDNNGERFSRPNDITFYQGVIYFTDPKSYSKEIKDGRIYTLNPVTEEIRLFADGLAFPNGIAISPDGEKVLVCESAMNRIIVLSMQDPNEREVLINLPGGDPDGDLPLPLHRPLSPALPAGDLDYPPLTPAVGTDTLGGEGAEQGPAGLADPSRALATAAGLARAARFRPLAPAAGTGLPTEDLDLLLGPGGGFLEADLQLVLDTGRRRRRSRRCRRRSLRRRPLP